ncbi:NIPSNAP family protein [Granulosicoccus antarcticus]|uniref:NIPSNAP domain-containing protein n=1 Tax=Granulosicoccus antarcticus IMCC3135 TaxID=1192854 RepID=A0A2Z2NS78_9GAMM|nr:NIPSNAP family protein [Granulosicoccus antarcticus]ASJ74129.1 hypothetical protein IMCC3135_20255 [Granulosicoccus antarcticus IMCC3135]
MLYDVRTYRCQPGTIAAQLKLYKEHGWDVQRKHLGEPLVYGQVETGDVNSYIHIWVYESAADRENRRKNMVADPLWQVFLKHSAAAGNLILQTNTLVKPAPFFDPEARSAK